MRGASILTAAIVLVAALAVAPEAGALPGPLPPTIVRGPIAITSDAAFTVANGVRSGTGTPADPFVISGWSITTGSGHAILVKDVTRAFVIRENYLETTGSGYAVVIENVATPGLVAANMMKHRQGGGVLLKNSSPTVRDNDIRGSGRNPTGGTSVDLSVSSALVTENWISAANIGVRGYGGTPRIEGNRIDIVKQGVFFEKAGATTSISGNVIANGDFGVRLNYGTNVSIANNLIEMVHVGVEAWFCAGASVRGNVIHDHTVVGIMAETCNLTIAYNTVVDGMAGLQIWQSDAVIVGNNVTNHLAIGVEWMMSEGVMVGNRIDRNSYGIFLHDEGVVRMRDNVLVDNRYGLNIPYAARQSIPHMQGNLVNGVNVDGTLVASQRSFFYRQANVLVTSTLDSGFSSGFYGATSAQGAVTLYEVDTARIQGAVLAHGRAGVYAVNSFNVQVNASLVVNNQIGVDVSAVATVNIPVPSCVVFVKNTTIIIDVDPPLTTGIQVRGGCVVGLFNNTILNVDIGVDVDAGTRGQIVGNAVARAQIGMRVEGAVNQQNDVLIVADNRIESNAQGMLLIGSGARLTSNLIRFNTREGVKLQLGAHPVLIANNVSANADGVVDATLCGTTGATCSRIVLSSGNTFSANARDGLVVNGGADLRGDVFVGNGRHGFVLRGTASVRAAVATGNGGDGGQILGMTSVVDSNFSANADDGLYIEGTASLRESVFVGNRQAGIRSNAFWVSAIHVNASANFDGIVVTEGLPRITAAPPSVPYPWITVPPITLPHWFPGGSLFDVIQLDPMFVHRSVIEKNERNAIRSGPAVVNATYNYFGSPNMPGFDTGLTGAFGNTITPGVHVVPWYVDRAMTTTGPTPGL